jgi:hypothetical protein
MKNVKWNLAEAITAILDSGVTPTDLSHELGFQDTSMVYRYKTGKTKSTSAVRALIIFNEYDMLLDDYVNAEHLQTKAEAEMSKGGKSVDKCGHILDKLLVIASYKGNDLRQRLLRLISDLDNRS